MHFLKVDGTKKDVDARGRRVHGSLPPESQYVESEVCYQHGYARHKWGQLEAARGSEASRSLMADKDGRMLRSGRMELLSNKA